MIAARRVFLGMLTVAGTWGTAGAIQERQPEVRARIRGESPLLERIRIATTRRARLGVVVDLAASPSDSIGATIQSVTPGGPSAKAGIKAGDLITRLDGQALVGTSSEGRKAAEGESLPGLRLVEIASQLKANQTVSVEYRRDGTRHTTSLVTGDEPFTVFETPEGQLRFAFPKGELELAPGFGLGTGPSAFTLAVGPLMNLQLAPINPELGTYFGTTEGVLVIDVPKETTLGVKPGDVILTVDGRKVAGPSSLFRILRSYDAGDTFKLEIMRNKSRATVTGQMEKGREF